MFWWCFCWFCSLKNRDLKNSHITTPGCWSLVSVCKESLSTISILFDRSCLDNGQIWTRFFQNSGWKTLFFAIAREKITIIIIHAMSFPPHQCFEPWLLLHAPTTALNCSLPYPIHGSFTILLSNVHSLGFTNMDGQNFAVVDRSVCFLWPNWFTGHPSAISEPIVRKTNVWCLKRCQC